VILAAACRPLERIGAFRGSSSSRLRCTSAIMSAARELIWSCLVECGAGDSRERLIHPQCLHQWPHLLYQGPDGNPTLKWIIMFKGNNSEIAQLTNDLASYYQHPAETMRKLSKQYPAMRIDAEADHCRKKLLKRRGNGFLPVTLRVQNVLDRYSASGSSHAPQPKQTTTPLLNSTGTRNK
jgi:hypothetical protein